MRLQINPPNLCRRFRVPNILKPVVCVVDSRLRYGTNLVILIQVGGLGYSDLQRILFKKVSSIFLDADWVHAWLHVEGY